ncbi:ribose transport system permease protein [Mumia flava]|uniref:Ribose transport system permease protein n=1 Tax=Mumia flava TaxID=1348852 RepID=A0A0B2BBH7_9ACTN|nr:ABC transporter permease [Mumia flava]PJJ53797.1 ribose transport system permease protein [Mumia flava]
MTSPGSVHPAAPPVRAGAEGDDDAPRESAVRRFLAGGSWAELAAPVGFVALVIVFQLLNSTFLTEGNVRAMLSAAAILVVLSVGQTFVIATGGIDLAIASTMTFGAVMFGVVFAGGAPLWVCILTSLASGFAFGLVQGFIIGVGRITDFIVTLGGLSVASGLALVISDGKPVTVIDQFLLRLSTQGVGVVGWSVVVALVVALLAHGLLFHTRFGTHVLAAGGSAEAASATGIIVSRIKIAVYSLSGTLAGLAAILLIARVGAAEPAANTQFLLNAVAAVVLGGVSLMGGRATIIGPVFGALLLTALTNGLTLLGVSQYYQPVAVGSVVVLAALISRFQK